MRSAPTVPEQRRESLFAGAAEIDHAAAGGGIARRPFQFGEAAHDRRTQRAGEMMAPLTPVEAGLAQRPARMGQRLGADLQRARHEAPALGGPPDGLLLAAGPRFPLH